MWKGIILRRTNCQFVPLIAALLLAACGTATPNPAASSSAALTPYLTVTPSPTFAQAPEVIFADTPLPTATPFTYTVKSGDTMGEIAEQFRIPLDALIAANPNVSPNAMSVGQTLLIPADLDNPTGEPTSTPAPFAITQAQCYPTADGGMWCFALARNDSPATLDNLSARLSLLSADGKLVAAQVAIPPLNVLPPNTSLPLTAFFPAPIPADAQPRVQTLTAIVIPANDARYLPVSLSGTSVVIAADGLTARISGQVILPADSAPAKTIWVAAVAYDAAGRVVGFRRWEGGGIQPGGSLTFDFAVASLGSGMKRVELVVEARP
jgi:LysM repeat protein